MLYAIVAVVILILDQAVKYWTNTNLALNAVEEFIPGFINLTNIHNSGAAWGFLKNIDAARWIFVALTVVLCGVIIYILAKNIITAKLGRWMLLMVMAGGIGNCIDRVINGYVVDMFQFDFWEAFPIFNVADIFVSVCGIIFCLWLVFHKSDESEKPAPPARRTARRPSDTGRQAPSAQGRSRAPRGGSAQGRTAPPPAHTDYITQLKRPVTQAKVAIEAQAQAQAATPRRTEDFSMWNVPNIDGGIPAAPKTKAAVQDPFEEFYSTKSAAAPKAAAAPASAPRPATAPAQRPAPASAPIPAAPATKKGGEDFSLEDILAEFSDK